MAPSVTDYLEIQQNEIDALRSIFMEDFVEEERKAGAWNKTADRAFRLKLKHPLDESGNTFVTLKVSFPTTYPKTLPRCHAEYDEGVWQKTKVSVEALIKSKPKTLLGSEMIYELATCIQEILEDSMQIDTQYVPALDEERKKQEAASQRKAEQAQEQERERQKAAAMEEEHLLAQMVEREEARLAKLKINPAHEPEDLEQLEPQDITDGLRFDQQVFTKDSRGTVIAFRAVYGRVEYRNGPVTDLYTVQPHGSSKSSIPYLVLKQCIFTGSKYLDRLKKAVQALESDLESLTHLAPHPSILRPLAFSIQRLAASPGQEIGGWSINILTSLIRNGSLQDLLETVGTLNLSNIRSWTIQIIEGLDFLHRNHIVHGTIHPQNILLERTETRATVIKLCDGLSQHRLHMMKEMENDRLATTTDYWTAPEFTKPPRNIPSSSTDIWDLGLVFIQMLFGLETKALHTSPAALIEAFDLSHSLTDILSQLFKADPKKRPTAFDLLPHEFLRNDDAILSQQSSLSMSRVTSSGSLAGSKPIRTRHDSTNIAPTPSRYVNDFVEAGRLGRGGFGEVVKARNKLDGRFYAIKKLVQSSASALSGVLSEIILLSRLNHPNIVRYFTAWIEEEGRHEDRMNTTVVSHHSSDSLRSGSSIAFAHSTSGLDFISSSGYPKIEFGYESGDGDQDSDAVIDEDILSDEELANSDDGHPGVVSQPSRRRSSAHSSIKTTLYIQMEYCERQTLRDLIINDLHSNVDEGWRLFRQILEGLSHVHANGIIHRDLKPDNIFIDYSSNVRIGDFGLAKNMYQAPTKPLSTEITNPSLTTSIGTTLYVAPEVRSTNCGDYDEKADVSTAIRIILFEMSFPLKTAMERAQILGHLHERNHTLPVLFETPEKSVQGDIIEALVKHKPSERPSSIELLRSGKIPLQIEDETIRMALDGIADSASPYYTKLMSGLFSQTRDEDNIRSYTYDTSLKANSDYEDLLRGIVKQRLTAIFRRHGAVEKSRPLLLPNSTYYTNTAVRLLNASGMLVQLPYDLTLPHARMLAKHLLPGRKTFSFGDVYREAPNGGHPKSHGEVDFDIVSLDNLDLALREAEVIKVIDEIIDAFPSLATVQLCYHINHSRLLDNILDLCSVVDSKRAVVKEIISKLNIGQWTWAKIRNELRAPSIAIPSTSLDELMRFDFRDTYAKAIPKLRLLLPNSEELESTFSHLQAVTTYLDRFSVKRKIYINPLSSFNDKFYRGNFLFQCIVDKRHRDVFAAGGRYDGLILEHRSNPKIEKRHAVGFNLGWERLFTSMAQHQKNPKVLKNFEEDAGNQWLPRRCDVLINSFDAATLRSTGIKILQELWANDISSELVIDTVALEGSGQQQTQEPHGYVVFIKQDESLRVRNMVRKEDVELRSSELVGWLRSELRDRDRAEGRTYDRARLLRQASQQDPVASSGDRDADVKVLVSLSRSKKTNRRNIIEDAQLRAQELARSFLDGPIAAVETKDEIFEGLRDTRLSDPDSWRKLIHSAPLADRKYLGDLHKLLSDMASEATGNTRNAFIYNFRTRACIFYDLGRA